MDLLSLVALIQEHVCYYMLDIKQIKTNEARVSEQETGEDDDLL